MIAKKELQDDFESIGLVLESFVVENISFPEEVEKAIDKSSSLGVLGNQMHNYTKMAAADAMRDAAKNEGMAGTMLGMGVMGNLGATMFGAMGSNTPPAPTAPQEQKPVKFCPECGTGILRASAKFCHECGHAFPKSEGCPSCGTPIKEGAKFCGECGEKL